MTALLTLFLALALACPAWAGETGEAGAALPPEYKLAAQSSRFNLYVREDTLAIVLESRNNGNLLFSTVQNPDDFKDQAAWKGFYQSGIVMEFIEDVKSTNTQADFINMEAQINISGEKRRIRHRIFKRRDGKTAERSGGLSAGGGN